MLATRILLRLVILVILFVGILQLGGVAVRGDLGCTVARKVVGKGTERLAGGCGGVVPLPHSDIEATRMVLRIFG